MSRLTITAADRKVRLDAGDVASVGRDPASSMPLTDERVSRRHALVRSERGNWIYEDLASSNGSFVDGSRIQTVRVGPSTTVKLGSPVDGTPVHFEVQPTRPRWIVATVAATVAIAALIASAPAISGLIAPRTQVVAASPSPSPSASLPPTRTDIVAAGKAGTVLIVQGNGQGSGAYLGNDRVLTALHVVPTTARITVSLGDRLVGTAQTIATDQQDDLALLFVPGLGAAGAKPMSWGNSDALKEGDELVVLGYPIGLPFSVKVGVVSGLRVETGTSLIQTDASLNPGMSGGPALDPSGRLVGITDFGYTRYPGLNFLVAATSARRFVNDHP